MNTKIIIGIVVVLAIIIVGGFFLLGQNGTENLLPEVSGLIPDETGAPAAGTPSSNNMPVIGGSENPGEQPSQGDMPNAAATITYSASGFSPNPVTIKKGETVIFVNESGHDMWIASAMHPTHAVYPEKTPGDCFGSAFDACKGISSGQSWSFTFNSVGEWGYHDHLSTKNFGKVIVK
ncbi:hypothetical protein A3D66_01335 [Candidatus Kaiserbacteria bacterium RIFCSPHIGHO2_02_FULL_50_9]|uniref:EfeO-type cupredoxin-like domain-containing protein n=1 Tax=Candidatus Kaiserbacteria bacterium RIFCSPLOWO2_01_FULL_51_21 TaxID=1798508 RepID=A0A1F6EE01_9BACT|nr:MAG: hypothetical protein A2761_01065 [Candidatus Kaiserbacteria bacterium RIFCSPHIGHO2_01_FULL_51_33]OGG63289.1 MAG: hypothetical protein A3D66_01335 [Candidatus Kaiserbacteria bacterium RIFCSPHIGHO2_02_FULL_50_9]OGG71442.1 MAG: hypothetical protein A3A35_03285 [Candidatus Kaiserbacteria bacterium RIFCSPLOWO2_01_FULL_51_21]